MYRLIIGIFLSIPSYFKIEILAKCCSYATLLAQMVKNQSTPLLKKYIYICIKSTTRECIKKELLFNYCDLIKMHYFLCSFVN